MKGKMPPFMKKGKKNGEEKGETTKDNEGKEKNLPPWLKKKMGTPKKVSR